MPAARRAAVLQPRSGPRPRIGAPLATSTQRGGTAFGVGVSLAITVIFLMLLQLTQAIGAGGIIRPELAAWLPGALFAVIGAVLLIKVRT